MAALKTIYITVRLDIYHPNVKEITDDEVEELISELDCECRNDKGYEIETEICGRNDSCDC